MQFQVGSIDRPNESRSGGEGRREPSTLLEMLRHRASLDGLRSAFVFSSFGHDDAAEEMTLSFGELERRARAVAAALQEHCAKGDRTLLLCPPGLDYVVAFYGCVMAGVVAVPAYPPRNSRHMDRLSTIAADAGAVAVLTTSSLLGRLQGWVAENPLAPALIAVDAVDPGRAGGWRMPDVDGDDLVFLQYTSGTTGAPKGVMVQNRQLMENVARIVGLAEVDERSIVSLWLPPYHDMGLVDGLVLGIFAGSLAVLMAPLAFLQRPVRWLKTMSRWRATHTIAPNFAFQMCVEQTTEIDLPEIDLGALRLAYCGAEVVRPETLEAFAMKFAGCGFQVERFRPAYGLAEIVVLACASTENAPPLLVDVKALQAGQLLVRGPGEPGVARIASCGRVMPGHALRIVDPQSLRGRAAGKIGEIWLSGPSVALGYWRQPEATQETFEAVIASDRNRRYLRTGDLGAVVDGQLYVLGRIREMVIVRGRNHYATDLERTASLSHPALGADRTVAFAVEEEGAERLVLVHELGRQALRSLDAPRLAAVVRQAIRRDHEIDVDAIVFVKPAALPRTSSGKLQRAKARDLYLAGVLAPVADWRASHRALPNGRRRDISTAEVETWIRTRLAEAIGVVPGEIARDQGLADIGLDSLAAARLAAQAAEAFGMSLDASELYDYPTVAALACHIAGRGSEHVAARPAHSAIALSAIASSAIAVVGMACRFPGASDPESFWSLLEQGREAISEIPAERFDLAEWYDPDPSATGKIYTRRAGLVEGIEGFDAEFFRISPIEAMGMDPQQRLMLEVAVEAVERAGMPIDGLRGSRAGVYVGAGPSRPVAKPHVPDAAAIDAHTATGSALSVIAGRVAYALGLEGPAMVVDTACSSSLVAIDQACDALRLGKTDLALAGGVNTLLDAEGMVATCRARMLSPDGRCKTFDARADGYVRGEGCGVVVLKRLVDAERDGDRIWAVIRGSAVNQDGASAGLTVPNGPAQQRVIAEALERSGLLPIDVDYLEAHGTGTRLGDPIEVRAAAAAYGVDRDAARPLLIGSVKTNIGHLEAAAGVAGIIKTILALNHGVIPRHLNFEQPSPHIPWESLPVRVVGEGMRWATREGRPRRAGVSSFGFSGTNAHLIIESYGKLRVSSDAPPSPPERGEGQLHRLLPLSAKNGRALRDAARRMVCWLEDNDTADLADLAYTAGIGRSHFGERAGLVFGERNDLVQALVALADGRSLRTAVRGSALEAPRIGFLFTGQGSQWQGMGRVLYETEPVFRDVIDRCDNLVRRERGASLLAVLSDRPEAAGTIDDTAWTQPCLFAFQAALVELCRRAGVKPTVVMGHSIGELAACYAAGVFDLEEGLRLALARGTLMGALPAGGAMAAVFAPAEQVAAALTAFATLSLAADNGMHQVVSGPDADLLGLTRQFSAAGVRVEPLAVSHAFHSALMDPMLDALEQAAAGLAARAPVLPLVSNVTGEVLEPTDVPDAAYWRAHARRPVRFARGLAALDRLGVDVLLEIGPRPVLTPLATSAWPGGRPPRSISLVRWRRPESESLALALAELYVSGVAIDFDALNGGEPRTRLSIPTYPFQRPDRGSAVSFHTVANSQSTGSTGELIGRCISNALRIAEAGVPHDKPLGELGLDSLLAMEILGTLESRFGVRLPPAAIGSRSTIASLAGEVDARVGKTTGTARKIASVERMRADAELGDEVAPPTACEEAAPSLRHVLLTGATGYLGRALLERLLAASPATVYCLVRGSATLADLAQDERVVLVEGDLTLPRFGLEPAHYDGLAQRIDCVVHAAARVNWLLSYDDLAPLNVGGTREVLRFAARGRSKQVHVVSTLGVFPAGLAEGQGVALESAVPQPNANRFENAYAQSKCVAEMMCAEARRRGLDVSIHRMDFLTSPAGGGAMPWRFIVPRTIAAAVELGCLPDIPVLFDFLPVDAAAAAIVALATMPGTRVEVSHLLNSEPMSFRTVREVLVGRGLAVQLVPYDAWIERIASSATGSLYPFLAFLRDVAPFIAGYGDFKVDDTQTRALLAARAPELLAGMLGPREICGRIVDSLVRENRIAAPTMQSQAAFWGTDIEGAVAREYAQASLGWHRVPEHNVTPLAGGGLALVSWHRPLTGQDGAPLPFAMPVSTAVAANDVRRITIAGAAYDAAQLMAHRLDISPGCVLVAALMASFWRIQNAPAFATRSYRLATTMSASALLGLGDGFEVREIELSARGTLPSLVGRLGESPLSSLDQPVDLLIVCRQAHADGAAGGPAAHPVSPSVPIVEIAWGTESATIDYSMRMAITGRPVGAAILSALAPILCCGGRALETPLSDLPLVDPGDRRADTVCAGMPAGGTSEPLPVLEAVLRQADATPGAVAVEWEGGRLTYAGLTARISSIAALLVARGATVGRPVAVCLDRTPDLIAAMLACHWVGAPYVPLDLHDPLARRWERIAEAGATLVVTDGASDLDATGAAVVSLLDLERNPPLDPPVLIATGSLAYIIFTSGSTGRPKGVEIGQHALANLLRAMRQLVDLTAGEALLAVTTPTFDIATLELFLPLTVGGRVVLADREAAHDGRRLAALLERHDISILQATPATWQLMLDGGWAGRPGLRALCGGEALTPRLAKQLEGRVAALWNVYGPTEATIWATAQPVDAALIEANWNRPALPLGMPLPGMEVAILDDRNRPVPDAVPGELCLGGVGLAEGYCNAPELTAVKFKTVRGLDGIAARLYRTGDLAYREKGALHFIGRRDSQIKLRGYRIELAEIEMQICSLPGIAQAAVALQHDRDGTAMLVAYVVATATAIEAIETRTLRGSLEARLPAVMVPARFVRLAQLPLNTSGKIDRRALPWPVADAEADRPWAPPRSETERRLCEIWKDLLNLDAVGIHDSFFELQGHSLVAGRMFARISEELAISLPVRTLSQAQTVAQLAAVVDAVIAGEPADASSHDRLRRLRDDAVLAASVRPSHTSASSGAGVLLTGATGFLGRHLLLELLSTTDAPIHCLMRIGASLDAARRRLVEALAATGRWRDSWSSRLSIEPGDLKADGLGLCESRSERLQREIGTIYHSAAHVSFTLPYRNLAPANVRATARLLELACRGPAKRFHHVSTLSVFDQPGLFDGRVIDEAAVPELVDEPLTGYAASKWVAEQLVLAARDRGLQATIHRPGTISGDTRTGAWPAGEVVPAFIEGCVQLGALPDLPAGLALTPVDTVARAIVCASRAMSSRSILHPVAGEALSLQKMGGWLHDLGFDLEKLPYDTWRARLGEALRRGGDNALAAHASVFLDESAAVRGLTIPELLAPGRRPRYRNDTAAALLGDDSLGGCGVDRALFEKYVRHWQRDGHLAAVPA